MVSKNMDKYSKLCFSYCVFRKRWRPDSLQGLPDSKRHGDSLEIWYRGEMRSDVTFKRNFLAAVGMPAWKQGDQDTVTQSEWWRPRPGCLQ